VGNLFCPYFGKLKIWWAEEIAHPTWLLSVSYEKLHKTRCIAKYGVIKTMLIIFYKLLKFGELTG
jgi:hypothetical protein